MNIPWATYTIPTADPPCRRDMLKDGKVILETDDCG